MSEIIRFNEEVFWRSPKKSDLFELINIRFNSLNWKSKAPEFKSFLIWNIPSDFNFNNDLNNNNGKDGTFILNKSYYRGDYISFSSYSDNSDVYYYNFDKLRKISTKLGYDISTKVACLGGVKGHIRKIINVGLTERTLIEDGKYSFKTVFTLGYFVGASNRVYLINQINREEEIYKNTIIGDEIEDTFLDLIDSKVIFFICTESYDHQLKAESFNVRITFNSPIEKNINLYHKIISKIRSLGPKLEKYSIEISNLSNKEIDFKCIRK